MTSFYRTAIAAAALLAATLPTAFAASDDDPADQAAVQNRRESRIYDQVLDSNRGFRDQRAQMECAPIADPALRQQCLASFPGGTTGYGSSGMSRTQAGGNQ